MKKKTLIIVLAVFTILFTFYGCNDEPTVGPYQTTGIKIGEVTDTSAIIWTRLTKNPARVGSDAPMPEIYYIDPETDTLVQRTTGRLDWQPVVKYPEGSTVETIEGTVPGVPGEVRVLYSKEKESKWQMTAWKSVDTQKDYTYQFILTDLEANTGYDVRVESRKQDGSPKGETIEGEFRSAPRPDQPVRVVLTVSTGQAYPDQDYPGGGFKIYPAMLKLDPSFFVHTGDIVYYDGKAKSLELARWHWARTYSLPTNVEFHRQVASYFIKDDHDTWMNDCWPSRQTKFMGDFTFKQGQAVFLEQVPMGELTWRTYRWGKDLQIWLVEGRDYRSPNNMLDGPDKTIWGKKQKEWFKKTVQASDATFRLLISPTPLVGPDRKNKRDNHSNVVFKHEGDELRRFITRQKNMYIICGDRHWQYISVDDETGVREYSCGPASDQHAGGWSNKDFMPEHRYLKVIGGFLSVTIERQDGKPTAILRHHSVDGEVLNEDRIMAE